MASLYGVCFGKGLTTYWTIPRLRQGQVVVPTNREATDQDSTYDRLRWSKYPPTIITIRGINHHSSSLTMPYRTYSSRRGTRDKLVSTQDHDFPGFLPVCMRSSRGWSKSLAYPFLTTKQPQSVLMHETLSLHKDNAYSKSNGVVILSEHHNKILCQSPEMLAFKSMQGMHFLEAFSSLHFLFWGIFK